MGYPLEKLFGFCFFNKGLIRHLTIWETLHFQGFNMDMISKVNRPILPKNLCIKVDKAHPGKKWI